MRVRARQATFVDNIWRGPGEEFDIAEHHFTPEVHEDLTPAPLASEFTGETDDNEAEESATVEPHIVHVDQVIASLDDPPPIEPLNQEHTDAS